jgi:hypothetical protein
MRISSRGTVSMSLTGWIIAAPFIAIAWALYWAVVTAVKVTAWLIAALVARISRDVPRRGGSA